jgi:DNA helicase IV
VFVRNVIDGLARQVAQRPGVRQLDPDAARPDLDEIRRELSEDTTVQAALVDLWPVVTPQALVNDLLSDPRRLQVAAPRLSGQQRATLLRPAGSPFTVSDVPLLDEAAELLGEIGQQDRARRKALAEELAYARDTLQALGSEQAASDDSGIGFTLSMPSAEDIAALHDTDGPTGQTADRAAADREWTYGHVIVDEAQELSPMAWRSIFRRCPLKSMTVVGDIAQTSDAAGATGWAAALDPHARDRWRMAELTVNYRTPDEIMALAAPVLAAINPALESPSSVRSTGVLPWAVTVPSAADVPEAVAAAAEASAMEMTQGQLAVLHAGDDGQLLAAVRARIPDASGEAGPDRRVVVLDVREAKGLEFDRVVLAEPARIVAGGPHGLGDLYVAMTRATQQLGLVHGDPLPAVIDPRLLEQR